LTNSKFDFAETHHKCVLTNFSLSKHVKKRFQKLFFVYYDKENIFWM